MLYWFYHIHALHAISVLHFGVMLPLVVIINVVLSAFSRVSVCFDALWGGDHLFPGPLYVPVPLRWQYRLLHRVRVRAVRNSAHHSSRICHVSLLWLWVVKKWRNFHCYTKCSVKYLMSGSYIMNCLLSHSQSYWIIVRILPLDT